MFLAFGRFLLSSLQMYPKLPDLPVCHIPAIESAKLYRQAKTGLCYQMYLWET